MTLIESRDYKPCNWCGKSRGTLWNRVPCVVALGETAEVIHLCFYCRRRLHRLILDALGTTYPATDMFPSRTPATLRPQHVIHCGSVTLWVVPEWVVQRLGGNALDILYAHREGDRYLLLTGEQYEEATAPRPEDTA